MLLTLYPLGFGVWYGTQVLSTIAACEAWLEVVLFFLLFSSFPLFLFYDSSPASSYGHIQTSFLFFFFFSLSFFFFFFSASVIKRRSNMVSCFHVSLFSILLFLHCRLVRTLYLTRSLWRPFLFYFFALGALLCICYHVAHHFYSPHLLGVVGRAFILVWYDLV